MIPTKAQLEQAVADGLTQTEAAERIGCGRVTVQRYRKRYGVRWPHRGNKKPRRYAEVDGERLTLAEASKRYGIPLNTIAKRHQAGDRGERLVRPLRRVNTNPSHYDIGFSRADWQVVMELARERTPVVAARRFEIPLGAVNAALRGEEHRLG